MLKLFWHWLWDNDNHCINCEFLRDLLEQERRNNRSLMESLLSFNRAPMQIQEEKTEQHKPVTTSGAMAKMYASEACVKIANDAVQIHGGYGYTKDFPVEKFYRDSKLCTIGEGTTEIQKVVISRNLLK